MVVGFNFQINLTTNYTNYHKLILRFFFKSIYLLLKAIKIYRHADIESLVHFINIILSIWFL